MTCTKTYRATYQCQGIRILTQYISTIAHTRHNLLSKQMQINYSRVQMFHLSPEPLSRISCMQLSNKCGNILYQGEKIGTVNYMAGRKLWTGNMHCQASWNEGYIVISTVFYNYTISTAQSTYIRKYVGTLVHSFC